ncbi:MAG: YgiT-type zinc finger protein [bacterium]
MRCHVCGGKMKVLLTDLPFKVDANRIAILKDLPTHQCESCAEYLLDDEVMAKIDALLAKVDVSTELEVIRYAA